MKKTSRRISLLLSCILAITLGGANKVKVNAEEDKVVKGSLWIHSTAEEFSKNSLNGAEVTKQGDGEIRIDKKNGKYQSQAVITSNIIYTAPFEYMVLSWNTETPKETWVKLEAQVLVNKDGKQQWTNWLSWGKWSTTMERMSASENEAEDDLAYVDTDTLTIKGSNGETAGAVRYRITLNTLNPKETPVVRLIAGSLRNTLPGQEIPKIYNDNENIPDLTNLEKDISVPAYSQYIRDPQIASSICSPTSITMLLNYRGIKILPEETAWGVYDTTYDGFGNWPFNTAYASSYGLNSYVSYCSSISDLKREIYKGNPVAVSVKYRNSETVNKPKLPVVHGAPISYTNGHLIVVRGFIHENGKDYVIVNDSAAANDEGVKLKYLADEFDAAWLKSGRIAYIVHEGDGGKYAPARVSALLKETREVSLDEKSYSEFELKKGNEIIDLSKNNIKTLMVSKDGGRYEYTTLGDNKNIFFDKNKESGKYDFLIIAKDNNVYTASVNWSKNDMNK